MCGACRVRWTRTAGWAQTAAVKAVNRTTAVAAVGGGKPSQPTPHSPTPTVSSSTASLTCICMYMYRYNVYTCTDTEMPAYSLVPPTPDSSGHHGNRPLLSSRKTTAVATMVTSAGGQRSEVARQISYCSFQRDRSHSSYTTLHRQRACTVDHTTAATYLHARVSSDVPAT